MKPCRTCHLPWDAQGSLFTVCPSCRAKMPVRRVNGEPLNRRWKPMKDLPQHTPWKTGEGYTPANEVYRITIPANP